MTNLQPQSSGFDPMDGLGVHFSAESNNQFVSAGVLLRQARESSGLDINVLAASLKVPVKKLEALEMDRYDLLPDIVFVRALASSVCRTLKVDASSVLALLPQAVVPLYRKAPVSAGTLFPTYPSTPRPLNRSSLSRSALLAGMLLVVGAAVLIFLPGIKDAAVSFSALGFGSRNGDGVPDALIGSSIGLSAGEAGADKDILPTLAESEVASGNTIVNNVNRGAAVSKPVALSMITAPVLQLPQVLSSVLVPTAAVSLPAAMAATVDQSSDRLVVFKALAQSSWVKVTDAKGAVVLNRTIGPGDTVFAAGSLPLSVVVGRADATRVQVRGQVFDLLSYSKDNVARFEVK